MSGPPLAERFTAPDTATLHESGTETVMSPEIRMLCGEGGASEARRRSLDSEPRSDLRSLGRGADAGDLVVADASGITMMPSGEAERILAKGEERGRKEAVMMNELRKGPTTMQLLALEEDFARG